MKINNIKFINIKIILVFLATLILLLFISCFVLKNLFSYSLIEKNLSDFLGIKIELISPKTAIQPNFDINSKIKELNIYSKNKNKKFITIQELNFTVKPLSIIFNRLNLKKFNAKKVEINLCKKENGKIDLFEESNLNKINFLKNRKINLTKLNSNIEDFNFNFENNYKIRFKTSLDLKNGDILISKKENIFRIKQAGILKLNLNNKEQISNIELNISSNYPLNSSASKEIMTNIELKNFNLFLLTNLAKKYISNDILSCYGNLSLKIFTDKNKGQNLSLEIIKPSLKLLNSKLISPYQKINVSSAFDIDSKNLNIKNLDIDSNELHIKTIGNVKNPFNFSNNPCFSLSTSIINTQINNFIYFLPDNLISYRKKGIPTLKASNFYSIVNGTLKIESPLSITGYLKAQNVHIPNYPKPYKSNDVQAIFMKDKVKIYTRIYTPDNEYIVINGISNLDSSLYGQYSVKSTKKIDLAFAKMYLVPIQQIIGFNIGPVPIMDISGFGNIDIKTKGTIKDAQIFGNFRAYNASAKLEGLDAKLTNGDCELIFDNRNLIFKKVKGKLDNSDFLLTGIGNTKGEVSLNAKINNISLTSALRIFKNSLITKSYSNLAKNVIATSNKIDASVNLKGRIYDYEDKNFLSKLNLDGFIIFKNNKVIFNNKLVINKINGIFHFGEKQEGNFDVNIGKSKIKFLFNSKNNLTEISANKMFEFSSNILSQDLIVNDVLKALTNSNLTNKKIKKFLENINDIYLHLKFSLNSIGKIDLDNFNLKNTKTNGYILGLNSSNSKNVKFNSALIKINDNKLIFDGFDVNIFGGNIKIKGNIDKITSLKPQGNLNIFLHDLNLDLLKEISPKIKLQNTILKTGSITFKNDNLKINSLNLDYNSMPLFLSSNIRNIYDKKSLETNFSTILNEITTDLIINPYLISPLKVKGEIPIQGSFNSQNDNFAINLKANVPKNSDISFQGANLGDINYNREINTNLIIDNDNINIKDLKYIKYISNQNNKINPIVNFRANGLIQKLNDSYKYNNLKLITNSTLDVRILNMIFKKSLLKKGNFECNVNLNGDVKTPKINGVISLFDLDIPLYNTQINDIKVNIENNYINAHVQAKNNDSDLKLSLKMDNNFKLPYLIEKINITSNKMDIAQVLEDLSIPSIKTDISKKQDLFLQSEDLIIKDGHFDFKNVKYNKLEAQNLLGNFNYKDNNLNLKNVKLNLAQGNLEGDGNYNLKSTKINLNAKMKDCDANILSKDFLKLQGQIYGKMDGDLSLSAKNINTPDNIKNLKSEINFSINNGKLPKLGSLEYLLRAGNLFKNGLLGLSLNNLIQVLTPYKTGEFEKISGMLKINDGLVENLEIFTQGKNLSLYLNGNYHILENFADIAIYGKLSQTISNALGAIGNASINQFIYSLSQKKDKTRTQELQNNLNKIPPINLQNIEPRYFKVKVLGDINKDNYIKSFSWQ